MNNTNTSNSVLSKYSQRLNVLVTFLYGNINSHGYYQNFEWTTCSQRRMCARITTSASVLAQTLSHDCNDNSELVVIRARMDM